MNFQFSVDESLKDKLKFRVIGFENLSIQGKNDELVAEIENLCQNLASQYSSPQEAHELLQPMRELYRACGIDPTKVRPSSEALFRRAVKKKGLYQINSLVDVCNLCSLSFMLSMGLYDVQKISGEKIFLRLGTSGESYQGIGKDMINLAGRIGVFDEKGPFGNPSADSFRTRITESTQAALFVVFAPKTYDDGELKKHIEFIKEKVLKYHFNAQVINFE